MYGIGGQVAFAFGTAGVVGSLWRTADEDALGGAFGPGYVGRCVQCGFHVRTVEIRICAVGRVDQLGGERQHVPEQRALLIDLVDVEAGVHFQSGVVDLVEDVAVCFRGEVEVFGGLVAGWGEGEVGFSEGGVAAGFVEGF